MRSSSVLISLGKLAGVLLLVLLFAVAVRAQITPSQDAFANTAAATTNYGANVLLDVNGATEIAYIQFNLASIPAGASVSQATLKLYVNAVTKAGSFNVDYVNGTWTESTLNYSNAPALGTTIVSSVALTTTSKNQYILINLTPAVQAWLNGTEPNYGIALVANSTFAASFDSKENTTTSHPAELDIVYSGLAGVETGSGSGLQGGGTSGTLNLSLTTACSANQVLEWNGSAWACSNAGAGSVTSVGLTAPSTDFVVTGSPVTTSGTLGLGWLVAPDYNNTAGAIVKRDGSGNFSAGAINAVTSFNLGGIVFDQGNYALFNAFLGFSGNATMTGYSNTGAGYQAMAADTTGYGNTAIGNTALTRNTTGNGNIAMGGLSLFANVAGSWNTATGGRALYNSNGSYNTANGHDALFSTSTGGNNTAVGGEAMYYNTTGSFNTALGYEAAYDQTYTTLTNATAIGAQSDVTQNNSLVLGSINGVNGATASVNVGIGTTAPQYALDVHGTGNFTGLVNFASGQTFPGVATLGTANTFTGVETFDNQVNVAVPSTAAYGLNVSTNNSSGIAINVTGATGVWATTNTTGGYGVVAQDVSPGGGYGLAGTSSNGTAVLATSIAGDGVYATGTTGVFGQGSNYGVSGSSSGLAGVYGTNTSTTGYGVFGSGATGVFGWGSASGGAGVSGYSTNGAGYGTYGSNTGAGGAGVEGQSFSSNGGYGVYGTSNSGTGVVGSGVTGVSGSTSTNGSSGVNGQDTSASEGYGMYATSTNGTGVYASSASTSGTGLYATGGYFGVEAASSSIGVYGNGGTIGVIGADTYSFGCASSGICAAGGTHDGIYATGTPAGYFYGNMTVTGTITGGTKDFMIDHPLDPANKYLYHASVESSEMMNIYTGNVVTDAQGEAVVQLPNWFEALNTDFRYQLTVIGQFAQAIVSNEISNHRFGIKTDKPNVKVSWQVSGVRQDAFAKAHPLITEVAKTGDERGKYIHPVEHGVPEAMGIDASRAKLHPPAELPKAPLQARLPAPPKVAPARLEPPMLPPPPVAPKPPQMKLPATQQRVAAPETQK